MTTVASLVTDPRFLDGTHCIEFVWYSPRKDDAYSIQQIACCNLRQDENDPPMLVSRHRNFNTTIADPLPAWRAFLGNGSDRNGHYGNCALNLQDLLAPGKLVPLANDDRVPPEAPVFDTYRNRYKPDRFDAVIKKGG